MQRASAASDGPKVRSSSPFPGRGGFTLVELLIVVVILGVLAAVAIPQFQRDAEDTKLAKLQSDLRIMRDAIERYRLQHNSVYPGLLKTNGSGQELSSELQSAHAFEAQLTLCTDCLGGVSVVQTDDHPFGPYLKRMVNRNPFNGSDRVVCDLNTLQVDQRDAEDEAGWKFYPHTGVFHAADEAHKTY